jgi:hypothetical protein
VAVCFLKLGANHHHQGRVLLVLTAASGSNPAYVQYQLGLVSPALVGFMLVCYCKWQTASSPMTSCVVDDDFSLLAGVVTVKGLRNSANIDYSTSAVSCYISSGRGCVIDHFSGIGLSSGDGLAISRSGSTCGSSDMIVFGPTKTSAWKTQITTDSSNVVDYEQPVQNIILSDGKEIFLSGANTPLSVSGGLATESFLIGSSFATAASTILVDAMPGFDPTSAATFTLCYCLASIEGTDCSSPSISNPSGSGFDKFVWRVGTLTAAAGLNGQYISLSCNQWSSSSSCLVSVPVSSFLSASVSSGLTTPLSSLAKLSLSLHLYP